MTQLKNLILFILLALYHGTPYHLWSRARREIAADHEARVRKMIWELKKEGRVWEDRDGRLWPKK